MSIYTWEIPGPPAVASSTGSSGLGSGATARTAASLGGLLDQLIDPVTRDYVDADDGSWVETADSRTIVMIMLDTMYGYSYAYAEDGTRIRELLETGDPLTPEIAAAEISRAMRVLERNGILSEFSIAIVDDDGTSLVDRGGTFSPVLRWTDLASGSPVELAYTPLGG